MRLLFQRTPPNPEYSQVEQTSPSPKYQRDMRASYHQAYDVCVFVLFELPLDLVILIFYFDLQPPPGAEQESPSTGAYRERPHIAPSMSTHSMKVCLSY